MGSQQLLLLVLGVVLVGLAVVVGIQAFGENQKKNTLDPLMQDVVRISTEVQAWTTKPKATGGGAADTDFTRAAFDRLGFSAVSGSGDDAVYRTSSGTTKVKPFAVTGPVAAIANQMYGITNTGAAGRGRRAELGPEAVGEGRHLYGGREQDRHDRPAPVQHDRLRQLSTFPPAGGRESR